MTRLQRILGVLVLVAGFAGSARAQVAQPTCGADNNTSDAQQAANVVVSRATSTTAVVLTNYSRTLGTALDFTAADTLLVRCTGG